MLFFQTNLFKYLVKSTLRSSLDRRIHTHAKKVESGEVEDLGGVSTQAQIDTLVRFDDLHAVGQCPLFFFQSWNERFGLPVGDQVIDFFLAELRWSSSRGPGGKEEVGAVEKYCEANRCLLTFRDSQSGESAKAKR